MMLMAYQIFYTAAGGQQKIVALSKYGAKGAIESFQRQVPGHEVEVIQTLGPVLLEDVG